MNQHQHQQQLMASQHHLFQVHQSLEGQEQSASGFSQQQLAAGSMGAVGQLGSAQNGSGSHSGNGPSSPASSNSQALGKCLRPAGRQVAARI